MHLNPDARKNISWRCDGDSARVTIETTFLLISSDVLFTIVKSGLKAGETSTTLKDYDDTYNAFKRSIATGNMTQRVFACSLFGPSEAKKFSIVLVKGTHKEY